MSPNYVFVIDTKKRPLNPTTPSKARKLLTQEKAAVFRLYPFTIVLKHEVIEFENPGYELKIDPGSKTTGIAIVNCKKEVIWIANLEHRGELIKKRLQQRSAIRRGRRNRNTRYRPVRFENRKREKSLLPQSLMHRVLTIETWVNRLCKFCPINSVVVELVKFDSQKMVNSEISGIEYQQGTLMGYEVREYLLEKWGRKCAYCGKDNLPLEVEHIQPKSRGGSNRVSNLTLACHCCNQKKSDTPIEIFLQKKPERLKQIISQMRSPLKDASAVNSTRFKLLEHLKKFPIPVTTFSGSQTKFNRINNGISKQHYTDAACIGDTGLGVVMRVDQPLLITCKGVGGRQKAALNKFGYPNRHNPKKPIFGWSTGDYARHSFHGIGRLTPRSKGAFILTLADKSQKSVKYTDLKPVFKKDGYTYNFV
jgi:5-methylcytosine-specific restriction endonuclease McrA